MWKYYGELYGNFEKRELVGTIRLQGGWKSGSGWGKGGWRPDCKILGRAYCGLGPGPVVFNRSSTLRGDSWYYLMDGLENEEL